MRQEVRALDGDSRANWNNVIERYQNDYQSLKDQYEKEKHAAQRKDVFGGSYDPANVCCEFAFIFYSFLFVCTY